MSWRAKADKEAFVKDFGEQLEKNGDFILADYRGLTAKEITELRKKVREGGFKFTVVKNTLMRLIMGKLKVKGMDEYLNDPTALVNGGGELATGAKILVDYSREHKAIKVKAGMLGGSVLDGAQVRELAALPSREVLIGMVAGAFNAPIGGFATALNSIIRGVATVLDAVCKKKGEEKKK